MGLAGWGGWSPGIVYVFLDQEGGCGRQTTPLSSRLRKKTKKTKKKLCHPLPPTPTHYLTPQSVLRGRESRKITLPVKGSQSGQQMRGNRMKMKGEKWWGNWGRCVKKIPKAKNYGNSSCNDRGLTSVC